nr:putative reverse transcriptase domain-containing protein [Tanacetum cinerariifolium]
MNKKCSAILLNKLSSKEKDPGSFTISCQVSTLHIDNALADLGASIILMPYTLYEKLGLGEPKLTRMSLELADIYARRLLNSYNFKETFSDTARAMIDVFNKKITLGEGYLENIRTHQSSGSLDFEVLIVGYEHVVMNCSSAGIRSIEFQPGDRVFLKVSPARGVRRFGIKGKLSPRFIRPFEILDRVGEVSYRLALPPQLSHVLKDM